jgi:hypothetical protein
MTGLWADAAEENRAPAARAAARATLRDWVFMGASLVSLKVVL